MKYMIFTGEQAATVRQSDDGYVGLDPIAVRGGEHVDILVLPERLRTLPDFAKHKALLDSLPTIELDPAEAFPPPEEG